MSGRRDVFVLNRTNTRWPISGGTRMCQSEFESIEEGEGEEKEQIRP